MKSIVSAETPVLDEEKLEEQRVEYGRQFLLELIEVFFLGTAEKLMGLRKALLKADSEAFFGIAHTLKSNALSMGAMRMHALSAYLERGAKSKAEWSELENALNELEREFQSFEAELRELPMAS